MEKDKKDHTHHFYWDFVLREVRHKNTPGYRFIFAPFSFQQNPKRTLQTHATIQPAGYYIDAGYFIKLTEREAHCLSQFAKGRTIKNIAQSLNRSPRTIEVYSKKLREKLRCRNKYELREKLQNVRLLKNTNGEMQQIFPEDSAGVKS